MDNLPEVWLRGPVQGIPALLQPAAHALLQSSEEIEKYLADFPEERLHDKPFDRASVAFHLKHMTGVLDRMITYSKDRPLNEGQFAYLFAEKAEGNETVENLIGAFHQKVQEALDYFRQINPSVLTEERWVGRQRLPSTVIGLLFHAAEHAQRHVGALRVSISALG